MKDKNLYSCQLAFWFFAGAFALTLASYWLSPILGLAVTGCFCFWMGYGCLGNLKDIAKKKGSE